MIAPPRIRRDPLSWNSHAPALMLLLWACLWVNINSSMFNIGVPHSAAEWQLLIRALLPFAVLPVAGSLVLSRRTLCLPGLSPSKLLMSYGLLAAIASVVSPRPGVSLYWSVAFLASIVTAWSFATVPDPVLSTRRMLQVTWAGMLVVAVIQVYLARGTIFGGAPSGYLVNLDVDVQAASAGVARWAAVPGLVCVVKAYQTRRPALMPIFLAAAGAAFYVVYRLQSRGAIFGSVAAILFALFTSRRMRRYALPVALFAALGFPFVEPPAEASAHVMEYLQRGQTLDEFLGMSGRTNLYEHGLAAFWDAPLLGRGQWADRLVNVGHVHNSYLQALLNAGILGGIPYVASWIAGWILFFRLHKKWRLLPAEDRAALLEVGTVMMFFTVRSFPETTTASVAPDLLAMSAVYVYLEVLAASVVRRSRLRSARRPVGATVSKFGWQRQMVCPSPVAPNVPIK